MDIKQLKSFVPFQNLDDATLQHVTEGLCPIERTYDRREHILSSASHEEEIGFILRGECAVYKTREKEDILLQTLKENDSFGILTLFSQEEYPTLIVAKKPSSIVFFSKNDFLRLIQESSEIALNVITFLSKKVAFLNKKIATLSGATVEEKVENYLKLQYKTFGSSFHFNAAAAAGQINIGRASLYRILRKLEEKQIIEIHNKTITIKNIAFFERSTT